MVKLLYGKLCSRTLTSLGRVFFALCILYYAYLLLICNHEQNNEEYLHFKTFMRRVFLVEDIGREVFDL